MSPFCEILILCFILQGSLYIYQTAYTRTSKTMFVFLCLYTCGRQLITCLCLWVCDSVNVCLFDLVMHLLCLCNIIRCPINCSVCCKEIFRINVGSWNILLKFKESPAYIFWQCSDVYWSINRYNRLRTKRLQALLWSTHLVELPVVSGKHLVRALTMEGAAMFTCTERYSFLVSTSPSALLRVVWM